MPSNIKLRSKMAKARRAGLLPPALVDATDARDHLLRLNQQHGMALRQIAARAGVAESTLSELKNQWRNGKEHSGFVRYDVAEAIMGVQPEGWTTDRGARIPAFGVHRRIRALQAIGFNYQYISVQLGHSGTSRSYVGMLIQNTYTHMNVWSQVDAMYRKLKDQDPRDLGITEDSYNRARRRAAKTNSPPPHAWDDDTIDDPDAFAEWTGACGSMAGVRIHRKHGILPMCDPCIQAQRMALKRLKSEYGNKKEGDHE